MLSRKILSDQTQAVQSPHFLPSLRTPKGRKQRRGRWTQMCWRGCHSADRTEEDVNQRPEAEQSLWL